MPEYMTDARLAEIRDAESRNLAKLFDSTVTELLAEVDRLRAELTATKRERDDIATRFSARVVIGETIGELMDKHDRLRAELDKTRRECKDMRDSLTDERDTLLSELHATKTGRSENNGVGDVAKHIQAELHLLDVGFE